MNDYEHFLDMLQHAGLEDYTVSAKDGYNVVTVYSKEEDEDCEISFFFIAPDWHLNNWYYEVNRKRDN